MKNIWKYRKWKPMLLGECKEAFDSKDFIFELKFDGVRAVIFVNKDKIFIQSRNQKDLTHLFPELDGIKSLVKNDVIFDGEIVLFKNGKPSFSDLLRRIRVKDLKKLERLSKEDSVVFVAFDILFQNKDLTTLKLLDRKEILDKYIENDCFVKTKFVDTYGKKFFKSVKKLGLEGIVAKSKNGLYHINKRTNDFIKIKNLHLGEFFIGGFEKKKEGFLSLFLGEFKGDNFYYVGNVSLRDNSRLYEILIKSNKSKNYFCNLEKDIFYVKPSIKCKVQYLERTKNNSLRHPILIDL